MSTGPAWQGLEIVIFDWQQSNREILRIGEMSGLFMHIRFKWIYITLFYIHCKGQPGGQQVQWWPMVVQRCTVVV